MSRKAKAKKRQVLPDAKYGSLLLARFVNCIMLSGKKSVAEKLIYHALSGITEKTGQDAIEVFEKAIENVRPEIEVRSRRIGGATYQVPVPVRADRAVALAMRWLVSAARASKGSMEDSLRVALMSAASGTGPAVKKREDTHKMAEANRALAHYRW